jgi:hypothetical protein
LIAPSKDRQQPQQVYRFNPPADACNASRSHPDHRTYRSKEAAEADPAHPGCRCEIVSGVSQRGEVMAHFPFGRTVYDDREA